MTPAATSTSGCAKRCSPPPIVTADPEPADVAGFSSYLDRYRAGLAVEAAAVASL